MRPILLISLLTITMAGLIHAQEIRNSAQSVEEIRKEVVQFEDDRIEAILKNDRATLDRMYSDQLAWTMPNGDLLTKSQVLNDVKPGNQSLADMKHSNQSVRVIGDNVAVLTEESLSTQIYQGKSFAQPRRFTNVYVKDGGQWKLVVHAVTAISKP